ncbi:CLUMA_CG019265, isoform A [Clunio marinus]|uniref:CLUMA_CG019265, isoform A n=1 Tax=Clunio marinus TaxID=568069 RepID=A0A1J1J0M0_9DIPT|nr:CLUMA_CG019265, isoform A [Clunio marinus]
MSIRLCIHLHTARALFQHKYCINGDDFRNKYATVCGDVDNKGKQKYREEFLSINNEVYCKSRVTV